MLVKVKSGLWVILLTLALSACNSEDSFGVSTGSKHPVVMTFTGSKVFFEPGCKFSVAPPPPTQTVDLTVPPLGPQEFAQFLPLLTAVLPSLIDKGTAFISDYLENRAKEFTATTSAANYAVLGQRQPLRHILGCVIFVRGTFSATPDPGGARDAMWQGKLKDLALAAPPEFYSEYWMHFVDTGETHVALTPGFIDYRTTAAKRSSREKKKDLLITISFSTAKRTQEKLIDETVMSFTFVLPKTRIGTRLTQAVLKGMGAKAQPIPRQSTQETSSVPSSGLGVSPKAGRAEEGGAGPTRSMQRKLASRPAILVTNMLVTVLETEDGGDLLLSASRFIEENKKKIDPAIMDILKSILERLGKAEPK